MSYKESYNAEEVLRGRFRGRFGLYAFNQYAKSHGANRMLDFWFDATKLRVLPDGDMLQYCNILMKEYFTKGQNTARISAPLFAAIPERVTKLRQRRQSITKDDVLEVFAPAIDDIKQKLLAKVSEFVAEASSNEVPQVTCPVIPARPDPYFGGWSSVVID